MIISTIHNVAGRFYHWENVEGEYWPLWWVYHGPDKPGWFCIMMEDMSR